MAAWGTDPHFCLEADWTVGAPLRERQRTILDLIESPPPDLIRLGAVHDGELIGYADLHGTEPDRRELGFLIGGRDRWGHGLGLLTAAAGLDHGFGQHDLMRIWAEALEANHRSTSILRRLGMVETGRGMSGTFGTRPSHYRQFALATEDWQGLRAKS